MGRDVRRIQPVGEPGTRRDGEDNRKKRRILFALLEKILGT
jgi:hypothetical protein